MRRRSGRIADGEALGDLLSGEADRSGGRLVDAHDEAREGRLAAARLADDADGLARRHVEIDALDRAHDFLARRRSLRAAAGNASPGRAPTAAAPRSRLAWPRLARRPTRALAGSAVAGGGSGSPDCVTQQRALRPGASSMQRRMLVALLRCGTGSAPRNGSPTGSRADRAARPRWWSGGASPGRCRSIRGTALISAQV